MNFVYSFVLTISLIPLLGFSQSDHIIDSLKKELAAPNLRERATIKLLNQLSKKYAISENYLKATHYKLRELRIAKKEKNDSLIARCNERLGIMYFRIGSYDISSQYFLKALHYYEENHHLRMVAQITGNLANVYTRLENYKTSLHYLFIAKNILVQKKFYTKKIIAGLYINIGLAFEGNKQLDSAMLYYNNAKKLISEFRKPAPLYLATVLNNIGEVDYALYHYENASENYKTSLKLFTEINNENGMGSALSNIAKVRIKTKKFEEAIPLCNKALQHFENINSLFFIVEAHKQLSNAYQGLGNYKKAMKHLDLYLQFNDSLKGSEILENIAKREMEYAITKEQQKFQILEQQKKLIEKENKLKQAQLYITIGGLGVLLLLMILIVINFRFLTQKNKLKHEILKQKQGKLENELHFKEREIENFSNYIQEKNQLLASLNKEIKSISKSDLYKKNELDKLTSLVTHSLHIDNDRKELELKIDQSHQKFIHRLKTKFPNLTKTETRLCSLLLLELSSKEIATLMNIETTSVKMGRNRLRKKLALPPITDIAKFLNGI